MRGPSRSDDKPGNNANYGRRIVAPGRADIELAGPGNAQSGVILHFQPVGHPEPAVRAMVNITVNILIGMPSAL